MLMHSCLKWLWVSPEEVCGFSATNYFQFHSYGGFWGVCGQTFPDTDPGPIWIRFIM